MNLNFRLPISNFPIFAGSSGLGLFGKLGKIYISADFLIF